MSNVDVLNLLSEAQRDILKVREKGRADQLEGTLEYVLHLHLIQVRKLVVLVALGVSFPVDMLFCLFALILTGMKISVI